MLAEIEIRGSPIALGELGSPPSAEILKSQPKWVWFMTWAGMEGGLQSGRIKEAYSNPYFINRGDPLPVSNK
jgi:mannan endo-1,4-beta-mannosidase